MEDLITILIIVIGVGAKIYSTLKKKSPEPEHEPNAPSWDEFLESVEKTPELREYVENDPELKYALNEAEKSRRAQQQALAQAQAERDAAMLEAIFVHQMLRHLIQRGTVHVQTHAQTLRCHRFTGCKEDALKGGLHFFQFHMILSPSQ